MPLIRLGHYTAGTWGTSFIYLFDKQKISISLSNTPSLRLHIEHHQTLTQRVEHNRQCG